MRLLRAFDHQVTYVLILTIYISIVGARNGHSARTAPAIPINSHHNPPPSFPTDHSTLTIPRPSMNPRDRWPRHHPPNHPQKPPQSFHLHIFRVADSIDGSISQHPPTRLVLFRGAEVRIPVCVQVTAVVFVRVRL